MMTRGFLRKALRRSTGNVRSARTSTGTWTVSGMACSTGSSRVGGLAREECVDPAYQRDQGCRLPVACAAAGVPVGESGEGVQLLGDVLRVLAARVKRRLDPRVVPQPRGLRPWGLARLRESVLADVATGREQEPRDHARECLPGMGMPALGAVHPPARRATESMPPSSKRAMWM